MSTATIPTAKIRNAVQSVIPRGKEFKLNVSDSEIGKKKIVRVITPAWKTLRGWERIEKILAPIQNQLTTQELARILRFSVLTPEEYKDVVLNFDSYPSSPPAAKAAAKRKAAKRRSTSPKR